MKKAIVVVSLASLGLVILIKSGVLGSLALFLLVGIIPGTNYALSSNMMLLIIMSIVWLVVVRFAGMELFYFLIDKRMTSQKPSHKKHMPKRRYSQI
ncbi:MAG: hypothetical protein JWP06_785 [Candidatus Saccharibacteria bacterium]|nr:hypothetical protein [Candidatus Saccharibacteria bacterium]